MTIYDEIRNAKKLLEEKTGIDTKYIDSKHFLLKGKDIVCRNMEINIP